MCRITPSIEDAKHLEIPLHDISLATNGFSDQNFIANGGFGKVFLGVSDKLGEIAVKRLECGHSGRVAGQGDHEFKTEISLLSKYKHQNIVSLRGFCDEKGEKILVYKYESNGSLDKHLNNKDLTWIQRVQICVDAASGLSHVHHNDGSQRGIFHRDVKSANILLDENWNAKISDFGLSRVGLDNTQSSYVISNVCGTPRHIAPEYYTDGYLTEKSDVYSFGIVLWEVLCGRHVFDPSYNDDRRSLIILAQKHYKKGTLDSIIPSHLKEQIKPASLLKFSNIAYQCLKNPEERPTMKQVVVQLKQALRLQHTTRTSLSIEGVKQLQQVPLEDLLSATDEFADKNMIGSSSYVNMKYYQGISKIHGPVTLMRLDCGIGDLEWMTEIAYLEEHKTILHFLGHCDEGGEKIIVYKGQSDGSLYERLNKDSVSIEQRLRIAIDIVSGVKYLEDANDMLSIAKWHLMSSHIFLDADHKPSVFGFSSVFTSNTRSHSVITNPRGNGDLKQKSGVYSLGVVLWELLCGRRFTSDEDDPQSLLNLVRKHYKNQTLHNIIPSYLFKQIDKDTLITYSNIAYRCLNNEEERPTLREVEEQLEKALDQQLLITDCNSHQV